MKKLTVLIAILGALLMAALAGCSTAAPQQGGNSDYSAPQATAAPTADEGTKGNGAILPGLDVGNAAASGKKIIYTANITLEAKDASAVMKDISETVRQYGGYVSDSQFSADGKTAASWITVRIAPDKLDEFTAHVGTLGKILNQNLSSQDITSQYSDQQVQLTSALAEEAQYLEIMKKAVTIDDTLKVRAKLDEVQKEIEKLKGQLKLWDNQIDFSTVTISIQQPEPPAVVVEEDNDKGVKFWGFDAVWQKISRGFADGFNWTLNALSAIFMALAYAIIPLALIAGVTIAIVAIVRAARKRKKKA